MVPSQAPRPCSAPCFREANACSNQSPLGVEPCPSSSSARTHPAELRSRIARGGTTGGGGSIVVAPICPTAGITRHLPAVREHVPFVTSGAVTLAPDLPGRRGLHPTKPGAGRRPRPRRPPVLLFSARRGRIGPLSRGEAPGRCGPCAAAILRRGLQRLSSSVGRCGTWQTSRS